MRLKEFEIPLGEGFYIAVEIESLAGQITSFVVRLIKMADPDVNIAQTIPPITCLTGMCLGGERACYLKTGSAA